MMREDFDFEIDYQCWINAICVVGSERLDRMIAESIRPYSQLPEHGRMTHSVRFWNAAHQQYQRYRRRYDGD